jgi:hypothetical protein
MITCPASRGNIGYCAQAMGMKRGRRHVEHRHIHQTSKAHRDHHVRYAQAEDAQRFPLASRNDALLHQGRVQIDHVGHDGCPDDAH